MAFNINALKRVDPTKTTTLRSNFARAIAQKFDVLKREMRKYIVDDNRFHLTGTVVANMDGAFTVAEEGAHEFSEWLDEILLAILLTPRATWSQEYIREAYHRGILHGRQELNKEGITTPALDTSMSAVFAAFSTVQHEDRFAYIQSRLASAITKITNDLKGSLDTIIKQGIMEGVDAETLAARLWAQTNTINLRQALVMARTEIVAAHHAANIAEYRTWGVTDVQMMAEWLTAGDGRVCARCNALAVQDNGNGPGVYTLAQIEFMIPVHPQCRCMALPHKKK